jgi:cytoskeletal protein CcmA (bactofilin family)
MAWKKIIVSGSQAELAGVTGSFTGSFFGDGSGLTGLSTFAVTNEADNRVITSTTAGNGNAEANLTFDGSILTVTGAVSASGNLTIDGNTILGNASGDSVTINAQTINVPNIAAGTDNSVVVYNGSSLVTDEIDSRVWGTTLLDNNGTPLTANRVPYATDGDSLIDSANLTFDGTILTANAVTVTNDLNVGGNLTVTGTVTELQITNLNIEDQFILLNSGSGSPLDSGIVFGGVTDGVNGAALFYDADTTRLSYTSGSVAWNATTVTPSGFLTIAYDEGLSQTPEDKVGNIKIDTNDDIFIYV